MGRSTWYYSLGVSSIVDAFVRVDVRTYLRGGAIDSRKANGIIRDPECVLALRCVVLEVSTRVQKVEVCGYAFWANQYTSGFHGVNEQGREGEREFFQQHGSEAKRNLSRGGRNQMGNEPVIALPEGADDFIVYYDARSKDLEVYLVEERGRLLVRCDI
ncbi:hypothetical protein Tco_0240667 [Tanacetum coccineum]